MPPSEAKKSCAVAHYPDQACLHLTLPRELWTQDLVDVRTTFTGHFLFLFFFSPSINIVLGLQRRYYHLQASFAAYILAAKGPHVSSATPALDCFTAPSGGTCVETSSTKVQNHTSLETTGVFPYRATIVCFHLFSQPHNQPCFFKIFFIPSLPCPDNARWLTSLWCWAFVDKGSQPFHASCVFVVSVCVCVISCCVWHNITLCLPVETAHGNAEI